MSEQKYEIFTEERRSLKDNTTFTFYRIRGIVKDPDLLPRTDKGGVVYPELKLCPFCGGLPKTVTKSKTMIQGKPNRNYYVQCTRCDARGSRFIIEDFDNDPIMTKLQAINAWNSRVDSSGNLYFEEGADYGA
ncbi:MAG: Lar family restriction alleviation protein [Lachnospiraceae bacterium]|nr:Lar family restriction alleviation protein [Lachnospiraceae bacterium]